MLSPEGSEIVLWGEGVEVCQWLRMKFSAGCLQGPPTEASRCYEFYRQTHDVLNQNLEQRDVLCFQNEHSDERLEQH